ncbi:F-box domain-containing protein [Paracoccidioides lutzii Pb01]|uniref:F-box domain-containing protein n=1 Tax=Paracoccidioides lutzii (strain ATCC MYA-826 / Pb01) TaxID=502779 RepID=C1H2I6_PARBA|nr:F-box domain-containing protein [Paracoccidioides lutzii Pb01]EEH33930.1 F-box domain-containing protein [Paracoccidioides lutzii Pb01]
MEKLPVELVSRIVEYVEPNELANLQLVSRRLFDICRDNPIWRRHCYEAARNRLQIHKSLFGAIRSETATSFFPATVPGSQGNRSSRNSNNQGGILDVIVRTQAQGSGTVDRSESFLENRLGRDQWISQWDSSYSGEEIDWYSEYIARNVPISVHWLQEPDAAGNHNGDAGIIKPEVKGMGLMKDRSYGGADKIIGPLDDGTLCLWDLNRSTLSERNSRGRIIGTSAPGILTTDMMRSRATFSSSNAPIIDFIGVGECVSVDSFRQTAYIAVGHILNEVDLSTLQVISQKKFPWSIFALSQETEEYSAPLTVGTTRSLHLYDPRIRSLDSRICSPVAPDNDRYVSLLQPIPLSILHSPLPNINSFAIAGRFSAILLYDRRNLSGVLSIAHSGSSISSLAALPMCPQPYASSRPQLRGNHTIVACGEYKGRGSLELFSTSMPANSGDYGSQRRPMLVKEAICQNRQSASGSKLLSVATHGTRIVFTDANGNIKWVERDGRTEVRRWNLSMDAISRKRRRAPLAPHRLNTFDLEYWPGEHEIGGSDIVRKILPTGYNDVLDDELLIWTGDRIGRLRFSDKPGRDWNYEAEIYREEREAARRENERNTIAYEEAVCRSLQTQREELTWMGAFGIGS